MVSLLAQFYIVKCQPLTSDMRLKHHTLSFILFTPSNTRQFFSSVQECGHSSGGVLFSNPNVEVAKLSCGLTK